MSVLAATAMIVAFASAGCGGKSSSSVAPVTTSPSPVPSTSPFDDYKLTGDVSLVHDPSIIREGTGYYSFSTDPGNQTGNPQQGYLPIRCSADKLTWTRCGSVFATLPPAVLHAFPNLTTLWAPDISYFNGVYHLYYAASIFGTNQSLIGLATNTTLNATDAGYRWVDQGIVLSSQTTDNFNAIDPNILVDTDASGNQTHIWLQYGSYWGGIFQREIDASTGLLSTTSVTVTNLATRPTVPGNPIEGSSLVKRNGFYYLFVSFDFCCQSTLAQDNYKIAVGRATSANGPFADEAGVPMLGGGGTILLAGNGTSWAAPGGETVYIDPAGGDLITFHALNLLKNGLDYLFVNSITWTGNWPTIQP